jgi:hypothetical protein
MGCKAQDRTAYPGERSKLAPRRVGLIFLRSCSPGYARQSAGRRGASVFKMRDVSRHKSMDVLQAYVHDADLFRDHLVIKSKAGLELATPVGSTERSNHDVGRLASRLCGPPRVLLSVNAISCCFLPDHGY